MLTVKEILEKEFKTSLKGYNQDEVDKFLDLVIQDYENYQMKIEQLMNENQQLQREVKRLSDNQNKPSNPTSLGNTNYDILQRLSNLEKKVFGSKL